MLALFGSDITLGVTLILTIISIVSLRMIHVNNLLRHKALKTLVLMDLMEASVGTIWIGAVT